MSSQFSETDIVLLYCYIVTRLNVTHEISVQYIKRKSSLDNKVHSYCQFLIVGLMVTSYNDVGCCNLYAHVHPNNKVEQDYY